MSTPFDVPSSQSGSSILNRHAAQTQASREEQGHVQNACGRCGATAYKAIMARDAVGEMRASGQYQCAQCNQVFSSLLEWKAGTGTDRRQTPRDFCPSQH